LSFGCETVLLKWCIDDMFRVFCVRYSDDGASEVELAYLENAQMLALYGIHMYPAKVYIQYSMLTRWLQSVLDAKTMSHQHVNQVNYFREPIMTSFTEFLPQMWWPYWQ